MTTCPTRTESIAPVEVDTLVVGAGPAGLAVSACLRRAGRDPVLLEREASVAASWRRHYDRLHLHNHKRSCRLPFAPWPHGTPAYPSRDEVVAYFESYARRFDLAPNLSEEVLGIRRSDGAWDVRSTRNRYRSARVVVATGMEARPHVPAWPGQEAFRGRILHSSDYRNGRAFRGQRVLVVGFGNSGGEIAIDLWEHGARPVLSVRGNVNLVPRRPFGLPIEEVARVTSRLPARLAGRIARTVRAHHYGDLERHGLRLAPLDPLTQMRDEGRVPLIDVGTADLIRRGDLPVRPGIDRFTPEGVRFVDGHEGAFDAAVLATGYRPDFARLLAAGEDGRAREPQGVPLTPSASGEGLYFCGFTPSVGGRLHSIAREARAIARSIVAAAHDARAPVAPSRRHQGHAR